jgi:hypothetical protein
MFTFSCLKAVRNTTGPKPKSLTRKSNIPLSEATSWSYTLMWSV